VQGEGEGGCCPYIQLFKGGKLICTASPPVTTSQLGKDKNGDNSSSSSSSSAQPKAPKQALQWIRESDGCISFNVDCAVQGDILLRCRHAEPSGARISMFRAAFHTGYAPTGVMRLTRQQLDGAEGRYVPGRA